MAPLCKKIDDPYLNSDNPTRTQTEEAFSKMFMEMLGDLKGVMRLIGAAVIVSLVFVAGNAMAMALRERTTEIAVLKAIGFGKPLVLFLVLAEAMLVSGLGGFARHDRLQAALRRRRRLAVTRAGSCRSSTSPGRRRSSGLVVLAADRVLQRRHPGGPGGAAVGRQRAAEGGLNAP